MEIVWWILGALLVLVSALLAITHAAMVRRFELLEDRMKRAEDLLLKRGIR